MIDKQQLIEHCIFREAHDAFFILDPNTLQFVEINPAAQRISRLRRQQLLERRLPDLFDVKGAGDLTSLIQACKTTSHLAAGEDYFLVTPDGHIPVQVTVSRIHTEPQPLALLSVRNLSKQRRLEAELRASETRFRDLVETAPEPIAILRQGRFVYANLAMVGLLGANTADSLREKSVTDFLHPDDRLASEERQAEMLRTGRTLPVRQFRVRRLDDRAIIVESCGGPCIYEGQPAIQMIARDVTERKQAEEALQASEGRFRQLIEHAPEAVVIVDGESHRFIQANPAAERLFKLPFGELCKFSPVDLSPTRQPDGGLSQEKAREFIARALAGQTPIFEWTHRDSEGHDIPCEVRLLRMEIGGRAVVRGSVTDISERKRAEDEHRRLESQIQHAQKLESLGVLAGGIAHDFNNLLTSILGYADLARLALPPGSAPQSYIDEVVKGARRAAELTQQMLAYSGKGRFVIQPLNLSAVVEDMGRLLEISISKKCVLQYHFMPNLPACEADTTQVRQIIMNLIINASEAIGDQNGVIAVTTGVKHCDRNYLSETHLDDKLSEGLYVYLEVADSGCGMSEEIKARLFDPFFTTKFTGRGLGLAAVLGIVRGHRGAIKVISEIGKGTTFRVLFPATIGPARLEPVATAATAAWRGSGLVLIVDDEESIRGLARQMMERMGFSVLTAADGREGVEVFRRESDRIRLTLLDVTMPHLDGEQTFREMRRIRTGVPTVLCSGYDEGTATNRFAGTGLAAFIQKPFQYQQLEAVVRKALMTETTPAGL